MLGIIADTIERWCGFALSLTAETLRLWGNTMCVCINDTLVLWFGLRIVRADEYNSLFTQACNYNHMRKKLESIIRRKSEQNAKLNVRLQEALDNNKWLTEDIRCRELEVSRLKDTTANLRKLCGKAE